MVVLYIVSWLPYTIVALFGILGLSDLVTPYSAEIPVLLAKTSAVWNPIVYALTGWSKIYQHHERRNQRYRTTGSSSASHERRPIRNTVARPDVEPHRSSPVSGGTTCEMSASAGAVVLELMPVSDTNCATTLHADVDGGLGSDEKDNDENKTE